MACLFTTTGCNGVGSPPPHCAYCQELAKDADLTAMAAVFPLSKIRELLAPRVAKAARAPMADVPLARGGKHVNKGPVAGPTFELSALTRSAGDQNCALCASAGCVNLALGYVKFTTKKVAKLEGVEDGYKAFGNREEQEKRIINFVSSHLLGYQHHVHGSDSNRVDLETALGIMKRYPDGTAFVISTTGGISKGGVELSKTSWGHWLNAVKNGGTVLFVDFQTDHEQRLGRGFVSSQPILGNFGVEWDNPRMQVIAFVPPSPLASSGGASPRHSGLGSPASAAASASVSSSLSPPLPLPVLDNTSTQQVVPLSPPPTRAPTNRQLKGRAMFIGTAQQLEAKQKRQGGVFSKPQ
jgi:hypothetical protein